VQAALPPVGRLKWSANKRPLQQETRLWTRSSTFLASPKRGLCKIELSSFLVSVWRDPASPSHKNDNRRKVLNEISDEKVPQDSLCLEPNFVFTVLHSTSMMPSGGGCFTIGSEDSCP
jgi:hypothetical protein